MHLTLGRWLGFALLTLHVSACAPPNQGAAGRGAVLVVGVVNPASLEWVGGGHGRHRMALARPLEHLAAGLGGSVITLTAGSGGGGRMELDVLWPGSASHPPAAVRRLGGVDTSGVARLAADGQRYAVVAYQRRLEAQPLTGTAPPAADARCPLLVVDLLVVESVPVAAPCRAEERVRSLALEPAGGLAGNVPRPGAHAYVGLEDTRHGGEFGGRLLVVALPSGAVVDALALSGGPVDLRLAPAGPSGPAALYVLEQAGGAGGIVPTPERGRVLVLDPLTLDVLGDHALSAHAARLVPAPDGRSAFLVREDTVQRLDLATGTVRQIARLPGRVVAAEVFGERLYLASPETRVLWVLDVRTGSRQPDLRLAGHPVKLALAAHRPG